jgi:hypothetical protein
MEDQIETGATIGAIANPVLRAIFAPLASHITPTTADSAQALIDQGIPVRIGQVPGANKITALMDKVFSAKGDQNVAFAKALSTHAGSPTGEINQSWVNGNRTRIGNEMNNIQSVYNIPRAEPGLMTDLQDLRNKASDNLLPENAVKVHDFIDKIDRVLLKKDIDGPVYKNITQKGGIIDNMSKDPDIKTYSGDLREILDDAWGRNLPADKKAAWDEARRQYKVNETIDNSMGAVGAAEGKYNPRKLLAAVEARYGNTANAGDLGMLARGGQFLDTEKVPSSHSFGPWAKGALTMAGAATAAGGGHAITHFGPEFLASMLQHPELYAVPAAAVGGAYGAGKGINAWLNSQRATQYGLDLARGTRSPVLRNVNPALPFAVEMYNRQ